MIYQALRCVSPGLQAALASARLLLWVHWLRLGLGVVGGRGRPLRVATLRILWVSTLGVLRVSLLGVSRRRIACKA